jgi:hypothetical protein
LGTPREVVFHHATFLEGVFDGASMVWAWLLEHLIKNSQATLRRGSGALALSGGHKGVFARMFVFLLLGVAARATLVGVLLLLAAAERVSPKL